MLIVLGVIVWQVKSVYTRLSDVETAQALDRKFLIQYAPKEAQEFQSQLDAAKQAVNKTKAVVN